MTIKAAKADTSAMLRLSAFLVALMIVFAAAFGAGRLLGNPPTVPEMSAAAGVPND